LAPAFSQDSLNNFLAVAEELAVKGLASLETNEPFVTAAMSDDGGDNIDDDVTSPTKRPSSAAKKSAKRPAPTAGAAKRKGPSESALVSIF
jgi:hypothetical protein